MRSMFRSTLLVLVSLLAVSAVASASASAAPEWLLNEKPVTESTPVTFTLRAFEASDTKSPGGAVTITCGAGSGKGTVAPSGGGSITEFKLSKCSRKVAGACKSQTKAEEESTEWVRMINLSWPTKLTTTGRYRFGDWVESHGGNGAGPDMGFEWECTNIIGTKTKDKCEAGSIEEAPWGTYITEVHLEGEAVFQEFRQLEGPTPPLKCSIGGRESGELYATIALKGPEGQKLTYKES
jgi:hypothetical protein